jgi:hypothetical protein
MKLYDDTKELKSVAIVAGGQSYKDYLQYAIYKGGKSQGADDVWTVNLFGDIIKHDLLFHMDDTEVQKMVQSERPHSMQTLNWLHENVPFFTTTVYPDYPNAMEYTLEAVVNKIRTNYLGNSVSYALAYAILREIPKVYIFGADFWDRNKHLQLFEAGRANVEFIMGIGHCMGVCYDVCGSSRLLDTNKPSDEKPYGYDAHTITWDKSDGGFKMIKTPKDLPTMEELNKRENTILTPLEEAMQTSQRHDEHGNKLEH